MPSAPTLNQVRAAAAKYASIRVLSDDEVALIAEAVEAGATMRRDSALEDYLTGEGGLPLDWGTYVHSEDFENAAYQRAAGVQEIKRAAFQTRMTVGDLTPLAYRILAQRAAHVAKAA